MARREKYEITRAVRVSEREKGKVTITGNYYNSWRSSAMLATHA